MKQARHSLALSLISLVLCITMLLGSTWAWFTDSVTSTNNRIATGILDIELEYYNNGSWDKVTETTNIFREDTLWEPGHAEVVYFKISNLGSLALKYNFGVNVVSETLGINVSGDAFKLSDHIRYGVDLGKQPEYSGGQEAISAVSANSTPLNLRYSTQSTMNEGAPEAYLALVVYMPETVGNVANAKVGTAAPQINLGITLAATQNTVEADSFGPDYDAGAFFPDNNVNVVLSAPVVTDTENKSVSDVTVGSDDSVSALVPAGALIEPGTDTLTLKVSELETTNSNITVSDGEESRSLDVHVDGIADGNTVPVVVSIKELMPKGLNMGNYTLYHVEDTTPVVMTYVTGTPVNHNEFSYDPVTGDVVVAMKSFSVVAMVAEVNKAWKGVVNFDWYDTEAKELVIANADQLWALSQIVGGMAKQTIEDETVKIAQDSFKGKTVTLACDINLDDGEDDGKIFYPIGYYNSEGTYEKSENAITSGFYTFEGTFDGNGHTISDFYQNTWEMKGDHDWYAPKDQHYRDGMGLFGKVYGGTVKNLTVDNFSSDGEITTTGVIAAYADFGANFENIAITNCNPRVYNIGNGGIVGCVGWYTKDTTEKKVTFKNITADSSNKISALWGSYDVACGGIVGQYYPTSGQTSAGSPKNPGIDFESCNISAQIDVFNDVCGNYQYYAYRYAGMMIGSIRENETINGRVYPKMDGITAKDCKVHYETWNDYFYCELVANSLASYTHDHQFSRLERVKSVSVEGNTITKLDDTTFTVPAEGRYNYVVVEGEFATENATCYHFVDGKVWNHETAGYEATIDEDGDGNPDLKEDKQHIYLPFAQLFTGYGWGVTSKGLSDYEGIETMDITSTDQRESVEKFEAKFENNTFVIGDGCAVTIGNLFEALDGISINNSGVFVSVESAEDGKTIVGKFEANADDWRKSTLTFNGTGLAKLTIQDYDYCIPTTLYIKVQEVAVGTDGVSKIVGLSKDKTYEYAPATILDESKWSWTKVTEVSEIQVEEAGLWAVRVEGSSYCDYVLVGQTEMDGALSLGVLNNKEMLVADLGKTKGWTIDKWSSDYSTLSQTTSGTYSTTSQASIALWYVIPDNTETVLDNVHTTFNYKYANPSTKIIPIEKFDTLKFQINTNSTDYSNMWSNHTLSTFKGTVRIYVADSNVEGGYYEIPFTWGGSGNKSAVQTIKVNNVLTNPSGYITGVAIFPWGGTPDTWELNTNVAGKQAGFQLYLQGVSSYDAQEAPVLSIVGDAYDGKYEIGGFDANTQYVVSTDLINFQSIGDEVTSYKVSNTGTYYFKAISSTGESPATKVVIDGSRDTVPELEAQNNQVIADDQDYEWARYTYAGYSEWEPLKAGDTLTLNDGLTAIRLPADETHAAGKPQLLYKAGENVGSIGLELNTSSITPVVGKWTNTIDLTTSTSLLYDLTTNPTRSFGMVSWFTQTADIGKNHYYTYTLAEDEIISAQSVAPISIRLSFGKGYMFNNGDAKAKLRFHIAGGLNDYYDIYFDSKTSPTNYTGDLSKVLPKNETGYLTGISFWPVYEVVSGSYTESWANQTARIMLLGVKQVETWTESGNTTTDGLDQYRCRVNIRK